MAMEHRLRTVDDPDNLLGCGPWDCLLRAAPPGTRRLRFRARRAALKGGRPYAPWSTGSRARATVRGAMPSWSPPTRARLRNALPQ